MIRTLPPELSSEYASEHDEGMWRTAVALLVQLPGTPDQLDRAKMVASLPMRMGGLRLRSAGRCARAAYWASWADAISTISERNPTVANSVVESLSGDAAPREDCMARLHACGQTLDREGFRWRPTWSELPAGIRPPDVAEGESGEWQHGWQHWSSSVSDASFRKLTLLSGRTASTRAHLWSHSGRSAGVALAHCTTAPEFTIQPHLFRTLVLERLLLPLEIMEATCEGMAGASWPCWDTTGRRVQEAAG